MKCPEPIFDRRTNKTRICGAEIRGATGLQEALNFRKHLNKRHGQQTQVLTAGQGQTKFGSSTTAQHWDLLEAVKYRAESGQ